VLISGRELETTIFQIYGSVRDSEAVDQAARCVCRAANCSNEGCGLSRPIPDAMEEIKHGEIKEAFMRYFKDAPFSIGYDCAAGCESHCVLAEDGKGKKYAVQISTIEAFMEDIGWNQGWWKELYQQIAEEAKDNENGKKVAVIGTGPAGLMAAISMRRLGYDVEMLEADDKAGGLRRYGIPDRKIGKYRLDALFDLVTEELGIKVSLNTKAGSAEAGDKEGLNYISGETLKANYDAVFVATGVASRPEVPMIPGLNATGVYNAMDFLRANHEAINAQVYDAIPGYAEMDIVVKERAVYEKSGSFDASKARINLAGKNVIIIGSGDTALDNETLGMLQNANVTMLNRQEQQPESGRTTSSGWPYEADTDKDNVLKGNRVYGVVPKEILKDDAGKVIGIRADIRKLRDAWMVNLPKEQRQYDVVEQDRFFPADAVLIAVGFKERSKSPTELDRELGAVNADGTLHLKGGRCADVPNLYYVGDCGTGKEKWVLHAAAGHAKDVVMGKNPNAKSGSVRTDGIYTDPEEWKKDVDAMPAGTQKGAVPLTVSGRPAQVQSR
jgi:NADPH-dependent glutamate synthase beta subunit-like oxidoreductase